MFATPATTAASVHPDMETKMAAHNESIGRINANHIAGQLSPAIEKQKAAYAVMDDLDGLIHRLMSVSDRYEGLADKLIGHRPTAKEDANPPAFPGLLGEIGRKVWVLRRIAEALEENAARLEFLA